MLNIPFHQQQLEFMVKLAEARIDFLNPFFRFLNYFDTIYFFLFLVPIIWFGFSYKWGVRLFYWLCLNGTILFFAKRMFVWSRPSTDLPIIGMFHPGSFGFPSGGAMTAMFLGLLFIYKFRTNFAWFVGISYILLISFSRIYLGVHYPIDVLGGWVLAGIMFLILVGVQKPLEDWLTNKGHNFCLLLSMGIPLTIILISPSPRINFLMGSVMGVGLGVYLSLKYRLYLPEPKTTGESIVRSFIGVAFLFSLFFLFPKEMKFSKGFLICFLISSTTSVILKWVINLLFQKNIPILLKKFWQNRF